MTSLLIMADDFTGALDTGVKFAKCGAQVRIVTDYQCDLGSLCDRTEVVVIDAETRHLNKKDAYQRIYQIVATAQEAGIFHIFKKTDSALRGNIGSELTAALDASGQRILHFLPAFPKMGRTTYLGHHYIDHVPVDESVFGQDPFEPVFTSDIAELIHCQSPAAVKIVSDGKIITETAEPTIVIYDARTDGEMAHLLGQLAQQQQLSLIAGCAGLAEALAEHISFAGGTAQPAIMNSDFLAVCGSVNPITVRQIDYAVRQGFGRISLNLHQKLEKDYFLSVQGAMELAAIIEQIARSPRCILDAYDNPAEESALDYAKRHGISREKLRVRIAESLGYVVRRLTEAGLRRAMLITGGDTLLAFMNQVGVYEMTSLREMAPGIVLSEVAIRGRPYSIISKSGGFGGVELLPFLADQFNNKEEMV